MRHYNTEEINLPIIRTNIHLFPTQVLNLTFCEFDMEYEELVDSINNYDNIIALKYDRNICFIARIENYTITDDWSKEDFDEEISSYFNDISVELRVLTRVNTRKDLDECLILREDLQRYNNYRFINLAGSLNIEYNRIAEFIKASDIQDKVTNNNLEIIKEIYRVLEQMCEEKKVNYVDVVSLSTDEAFNLAYDYLYKNENELVKKQLLVFDSEKEAAQYILNNDYPSDVKRIASHECKSSDSYKKVLEYLTKLANFPWNNRVKEEDDINKFRNILENSHYGMKDVKERVVESVVVKKRTNGKNAPILCLVGSPGVGKTSIVKAIAKAMNVPFQKISMSGASDARILKGSNRSYVGASFGEFAACVDRAECLNPVILIDEVDKTSTKTMEGNPLNVLIEALDPSQNDRYKDDYLNCAVDLSNVTFIATANYIDQIPAPLKDRMEMIYLPDYTYEERLVIFKDYVLPSKKEKHELSDEELIVDDKTIEYMVENYSIDGGIRHLEKCADNICRKACLRIEEGEDKVVLTIEDVKKYLGDSYTDLMKKVDTKAEVGIVNALAVNGLNKGGINTIECAYTKGSGKLKITGNMSEMTSESCEIAYEHVKWKAKEYGIDEDFFDKHDINVHFSKSAVVKDGNSAGIAFVTAIISAITDKKTIDNIAMTGEISLRGNVLEIGGLKEKIVGAKENGVKTIYYPKDNQKDVDKLSEDIKKDVNLIAVNNYSDMFKMIFNY